MYLFNERRLAKNRDRVMTALYGQQVTRIVKAYKAGKTTKDIAQRYNVSAGRAMAIKANLTRGTYYPMYDVYTDF